MATTSTFACLCCSAGCSNQCVVEFESTYYDCSAWTTPTATGPAECGLADVGWIEDPADCLRATRRVPTTVPKCCTNTADCSTSTATVPGVPSGAPDCVIHGTCADCCRSYTISVVGGCTAGTYDLTDGGSCDWDDATANIFLQCASVCAGAGPWSDADGHPLWAVSIYGGINASCVGIPDRFPDLCHYVFTSTRCDCTCPPTTGWTYRGVFSGCDEITDPLDCGLLAWTPSITVTSSDCP